LTHSLRHAHARLAQTHARLAQTHARLAHSLEPEGGLAAGARHQSGSAALLGKLGVRIGLRLFFGGGEIHFDDKVIRPRRLCGETKKCGHG